MNEWRDMDGWKCVYVCDDLSCWFCDVFWVCIKRVM